MSAWGFCECTIVLVGKHSASDNGSMCRTVLYIVLHRSCNYCYMWFAFICLQCVIFFCCNFSALSFRALMRFYVWVLAQLFTFFPFPTGNEWRDINRQRVDSLLCKICFYHCNNFGDIKIGSDWFSATVRSTYIMLQCKDEVCATSHIQLNQNIKTGWLIMKKRVIVQDDCHNLS